MYTDIYICTCRKSGKRGINLPPYACIYMYVYAYMYVYIALHTNTKGMWVASQASPPICIGIHICIYVYICIHMFTYIIHVYTCIYI